MMGFSFRNIIKMEDFLIWMSHLLVELCLVKSVSHTIANFDRFKVYFKISVVLARTAKTPMDMTSVLMPDNFLKIRALGSLQNNIALQAWI